MSLKFPDGLARIWVLQFEKQGQTLSSRQVFDLPDTIATLGHNLSLREGSHLGELVMKLLSKKQVREKVLYSFAHIARLEAAGLFPKRVPLGPGRVGYVDDEVENWIMNRIAERDARTGP